MSHAEQPKNYHIESIKKLERPTGELTLESASRATSVLIRKQGAAIEDLTINYVKVLSGSIYKYAKPLKSPKNREAWPLIYYTDLLQPVKPEAISHLMLPLGEGEVGNQHGPSRILEYQVESSSKDSAVFSCVDGLRNLGHLKTFNLMPGGLEITDDVVNASAETQNLSLGEHLYFDCPEAEIKDIRFLKNELATESTALTVYPSGEPMHAKMKDLWPAIYKGESIQAEFDGSLIIVFKDGRRVQICAEAELNGEPQAVDLLLWHREGTHTMCFEPIIGRDKTKTDKVSNHNLVVAPGQSFSLKVTIRLISPYS
jgi:hypothetical protein